MNHDFMTGRFRRLSALVCMLLLLSGILLSGCAKHTAAPVTEPAPAAGLAGATSTADGTDLAAVPDEADSTAAESATAAVAEGTDTAAGPDHAATTIEDTGITESGTYTARDDVALYIHTYGHLPSNFITKKDAQSRGWESSKGNLQKVAPGCSIGGDRFGNREGLLPDKKGRKYYECDIDYDGGKRNAKRIVFSDDGLIFYTEDHYASFEQLY